MKSKILLLVALFTIITFAQENRRYINVMGKAEMSVQADMIKSKFDIRVVKPTLEESKDINQAITKRLSKILDRVGIEKSDIEITPLIFGKEYSYEERKRVQKGFYSYTAFNVKIKDLTKYYKLIDKVSRIESLEMSHSTFGLAKKDSYSEKISREALLAAKKKAEYIAETTGVKLGKILEIDELDSGYGYSPVNSFREMGARGKEVAGSISISKTIRIKYQIAD